jgi:hypothetical protein
VISKTEGVRLTYADLQGAFVMSSALSHEQVLATKIDRMADDYPAVEVPTPDYTPLRRAQSISGYSTTREPMDNYPTPDIATLSLLAREDFPGTIWEPACGSGNIARHFPHCIATDIRSDNIFGEAKIDFLTEYRQVDHIITNPPYRLALPFAQHALECASGKVAMLCKLAFLEGKARYALFQEHPMKTVYVFSKRLPLTKEGDKRKQSSMIPFAWFVWENGYQGKTIIEWILAGDEE